MRLLCIHSDHIEYEAKKKAVSKPETVAKGHEKDSMDECLVVFTAVESVDEDNAAESSKLAVNEIKKNVEQVKTNNIMLYPYAHLSSDLAKPDIAIKIMADIEKELKKTKYNVKKAPFGWYKSFKISCKGHPLSELASSIAPAGKEKEVVSEALKAEEKLKSYWYIMDTKGKLHSLDKFDFKGHTKLKKFAFYEKEKDRKTVKQPAHIPLMKKLELVDYEPASDSGNMRYYPKGRLIKKLLEDFVTKKVIEYGGVEVETPIMYNIKHPTLERYLNKFPARQYQIVSDKKTFFLRFAACFGQFLMAHDATISYKNLPLKLYELTRYSFRREQGGELCGLRRLRAFTMPDVHALCEDLKQATEEYRKRFDLCLNVLSEIGIEKQDCEIGLRITKDFYEKNKELVNEIVAKFGKPILVEMWDERKFYFILKYEFNFIDSVDKAAALATDQVDVENGKSYDMNFIDKSGKKKHPIILHFSPSGAIERVIYTLLEIQAEKIKKQETAMLPVWLSPTQVRLIPVSGNKHLSYCEKLADELQENNIRVDISDEDDTLSRRIRGAEKDWVPYIVVIGDKEINSEKIQVRIRGQKAQQEMTKQELITLLNKKNKGKPFHLLPLPRLISKRPKFVTFE